MGTTQDETIAELRRTVAELRRERDAALARSGSEYDERIAHQAATIEVLRLMSASPGDPRPVFDMIATRARDLCDAYGVTVLEFDGTLMHHRASTGISDDPAVKDAIIASYPRPPARDNANSRAILDRRIVHIRDLETEPGLDPAVRGITAKSSVVVPLLRGDIVIGTVGMGSRARGGFSDTQVELLKTFAEQAVIAITSAETYRALQDRTADLQQSLEYQTATGDVLKVISRSTFDLRPVLDTLVETASRLCGAEQAALVRREGDLWRFVANYGYPPEYEAALRALGAHPLNPDAPTVGWRAVREARPVHIHDVAAVPGYGDIAVRLGKMRTSLAVPLLREGEVIGTFILSRQRVEPFTERQIELVSTFADQAVIAIENTRLLTEQREALEQQTATAEVLRVINASAGDLAPVFDAVLEKAVRLCESAFGNLFTYDGQLIHVVASYGISPDLLTLFREPRPPAAGAPTGRIADGEPFVHILDTTDQDVYRTGHGPTRAFVDQVGARTALFVGLRKDAALLGYLVLFRREVRAFSEKEIALVMNFAAQAVIAMENARLINEQREALEQQTATAEVLGVINASPGDLTPVFDAILEKAHRLCGAAVGSLTTYDGEYFRAVATHGWPEQHDALVRQPYHPGDFQQGLIRGERLSHIPDVTAAAHNRDHAVTRSIFESTGVRTSLAVPLRKGQTLIGYISAFRLAVEPFSDKQIALLENFATQAVIAMENARLINEQRDALEQQTATAEVLRVINASPGNLAPVFDVILEKCLRLGESAFGALWVYEGDFMRAAAMRGMTAALTEFRVNNPVQQLSNHPTALRLNETRRNVQHLDVREGQAYRTGHPGARAVADLGGARTLLVVPLLKEQTVLGNIQIYRQEVRGFSDKQIALLESFAAQAAIAMENARLINEQREALEQQTATAEVLQVINASPGDLAPVFDTMLEKAMRLCGAAFGEMYTFDGERFRTATTLGLPAAYAAFRATTPPKAPAGGPPARLLETKRPVHILDNMNERLYRDGNVGMRAAVDLGGMRTSLLVPLLKEDKVLGYIGVFRQEVRAYADKQIALLENFAAQAVIAMENARLINEQREALDQQTATAEVLQVINANPGNLAPVFDTILEKGINLCEAAFGVLGIFDGQLIHLAATHGLTPEMVDSIRDPFPPTPGEATGRIYGGEEFVHVLDVRDQEGYRAGSRPARALVDQVGARTALFVGLRGDAAFLGNLVIFRREVRAFSDKEIVLVRNFAAQAVIAMENARLVNEQREALEQQTATAEVLQVINASPGNLIPVFETILAKAHKLCGVAVGSLVTYDGELMQVQVTHGLPPDVADLVRPPFHLNPNHRALVDGARFVHIPDLKEDAASLGHDLTRRSIVSADLHTSLYLPLRKDRTLLGFISAFRKEVRPFSEKEIALLENFAAQAVVAMESARLLQELRARTDELAQRQTELRVTFENMGDGVAMFDGTQHLVAWNRKFQDILDVPDEIIARRQSFSDYVRYLAERGEYGPDADPDEQIRGLTERAGEYRAYERTRPDGRVIEIRHNPVPGGGFVLIYADITERKRNEAEIAAARDAAQEATRTIEAAFRDLKTAQANLIQAEKMASLGQLTAGIAHEIKNPLNFVNNFAILSVELLSELKESIATALALLTEDQRADVEETVGMLTSNLEKIAEHGKRADGIVKSMLEHSRGASGERRMVDINTLADEALNLAYHGARAQDQSFNITLERDFGDGIAPIEVNPQDMTRVLLNLFSNGFYAANQRAKHGAPPGFEPTLTVVSRESRDGVEIRVRDNGTGIAADIRDKLFQPFFTTKPTGEGTGLGLSITYDIVTKQHGGTIVVASEVNGFTEFAVTLPRGMFAREAGVA